MLNHMKNVSPVARLCHRRDECYVNKRLVGDLQDAGEKRIEGNISRGILHNSLDSCLGKE